MRRNLQQSRLDLGGSPSPSPSSMLLTAGSERPSSSWNSATISAGLGSPGPRPSSRQSLLVRFRQVRVRAAGPILWPQLQRAAGSGQEKLTKNEEPGFLATKGNSSRTALSASPDPPAGQSTRHTTSQATSGSTSTAAEARVTVGIRGRRHRICDQGADCEESLQAATAG